MMVSKLYNYPTKIDYGGPNNGLHLLKRFYLGSEKYWTVLFGTKRNKSYQSGGYTSHSDALCKWKSIKSQEQLQNRVLSKEMKHSSASNWLIWTRKSVRIYSMERIKAKCTNKVGVFRIQKLYTSGNRWN